MKAGGREDSQCHGGKKNDLKFGNRQKDARFLCRVEGVVVAQSA